MLPIFTNEVFANVFQDYVKLVVTNRHASHPATALELSAVLPEDLVKKPTLVAG
jgi:hypothetical protein